MAGDKPEKLTPEQEMQQLELEERKLRLEHLRNTVGTERARREEILRNHQAQQAALDDTNRRILAKQTDCNHKKGGKNLEGLHHGNDSSNYAVIKVTQPWNESYVMCGRCMKEWHPPTQAMRKADPAAWREQMQEFKWAWELPTDNEPAGSVLFTVGKRSA